MASSDGSTGEVYHQYTETTVFVVPIYIITIIAGSLGNSLVIWTYLKDKSIHRIFNFLITNLAVADLIICGLFTPILLAYRSNAAAMVVAYSPLCELCLFLSMLAISMMYAIFPVLAFHRKDVMLNPRQPQLTFKVAKYVAYSMWAICGAVSVGLVGMAWYTFLHGGCKDPLFYRCLLINTHVDGFTLYFLIFSALLYGASILVTALLYVKVCKTLSTRCPGVNASAEERHITKLCFWLAVVYTVCWTPFLVVQMSGIFGRYSEIYFNLHACSSAVGVIGSAVNPLMYAFMDPYYRRMFRNFFGACADGGQENKIDVATKETADN